MRALWGTLSEALERHHAVGLVTVTRVRGSGPREPGARMIVLPDGDIRGTIGGGTLEFQALQIARDAVNARKSKRLWHSFALGPDLGQCCGGAVEVLIEAFTSLDLRMIQDFADAEATGEFALRSSHSSGAPTRVIAEYGGGDTIQLDGDTLIESFSSDDTPVAIFGAGHVGRALVLALAPLPFSVEWFDSRIESFPRLTPQNTTKRHLAEPWETVACLVPGTLSLVMTHSHPLDLTLCDALLKRDDMPFIGLIGSKTKKKRFYSQLRDLSHMQPEIDRITCPIGLSQISDKQPAAIAASVAAQLLIKREELAAVQSPRNAMAEA